MYCAALLHDELAAEVRREYVWLSSCGRHCRVPDLDLVESVALRADAREVLVAGDALDEVQAVQ